MLTGYFNRNKYAYLASVRSAVLMLNLELFLGLLIINCVIMTESFSFTAFVTIQENF
jgi:NADH:ubiquinone oxidoreductase subunit H